MDKEYYLLVFLNQEHTVYIHSIINQSFIDSIIKKCAMLNESPDKYFGHNRINTIYQIVRDTLKDYPNADLVSFYKDTEHTLKLDIGTSGGNIYPYLKIKEVEI